MDGSEQVPPPLPPGGQNSGDTSHVTSIEIENNPQTTGSSSVQLKEALRLLFEVIYSILALLINPIKHQCSGIKEKCYHPLKNQLRRFPLVTNVSLRVWMLFGFLVGRFCPESRGRRKFCLVFTVGFMTGSFLYVSMLNVTYALNYEGRVVRYNTESSLRMTTFAAPVRVYTTRPDMYPSRTTMFPMTGRQSVTHQNRVQYADLPRQAKTAQLQPAHTLVTGDLTIPHIIHQSWDTRFVPKVFAPWMLSWRQKHPTWRHLFWTAKGGRRLILKQYPEFLPLVGNYSTDLHRYVVNRYFMLYHFGGVFADVDMESLRPLDTLVQNYSCVLTEQPLVHQAVLFNQSSPNYVVNSFMACSPRHPFMRFLLDMLETYRPWDSDIEPDRERVEKSVGSLFLGDVLQLYKIAFNRTAAEHVHIVPADWLMPNYNERYLRYIIRQCQADIRRSRQAQEACRKLSQVDFRNAVGAHAYSKRHWVDLTDQRTLQQLLSGPVVEANKLRA